MKLMDACVESPSQEVLCLFKRGAPLSEHAHPEVRRYAKVSFIQADPNRWPRTRK